eukprot:73420-Pleurochrysis_carterae.AAC.1
MKRALHAHARKRSLQRAVQPAPGRPPKSLVSAMDRLLHATIDWGSLLAALNKHASLQACWQLE